jgi:SAM-dependent methyltransferase
MSNPVATPRAGAYRCPACGADVREAPDALACAGCGRRWEIRRGTPIFTERPRFWGNVDRAAMVAMTARAETEGWRSAIRHHLPEAVWSHVDEPGRADGVFFLPMDHDLAVLDAGCMWGGLTVPLARRYREVAALDATFESIDFLRVRAAQEGLDNIARACGSLLALPYPDARFDLAFVNGVLEWVGLAEDFVVERDYGRRHTAPAPTGAGDPRALQLRALAEMRRVLRPGGLLYLAIENRYAYKYFLGSPDDHSAVRFTSLMPRPLADLTMRWLLRQRYRTYTYSARGLRRLLADAGLEARAMYACCDSYRDPQAIIPLDEPAMIRFYYRTLRLGNVPRWKRALFGLALAAGLGPALVPSFIVVAARP